jgi:hypothetical protein
MNITKEILRIVDVYGEGYKPELMKDLKSLKTEIEAQTFLKAKKIIRPLTNINEFRNLKKC